MIKKIENFPHRYLKSGIWVHRIKLFMLFEKFCNVYFLGITSFLTDYCCLRLTLTVAMQNGNAILQCEHDKLVSGTL